MHMQSINDLRAVENWKKNVYVHIPHPTQTTSADNMKSNKNQNRNLTSNIIINGDGTQQKKDNEQVSSQFTQWSEHERKLYAHSNESSIYIPIIKVRRDVVKTIQVQCQIIQSLISVENGFYYFQFPFNLKTHIQCKIMYPKSMVVKVSNHSFFFCVNILKSSH